MESLIVPLILGSFLLVVLVPIFWWAREQTRRRQAAWKRLAARRGGRFHDGQRGMLKWSSEAVEVQVGHAIVQLDLYVISHGKSSTTYTRARATYGLGAGPSFKVYEEGFFSTLGKALGTQDLELGDPRFDARFMVKGDDVGSVREAWTDAARAAMLTHPLKIRAESDGSTVTLLVLGAISDEGPLDGLLDLAGELASTGARELDVLLEIPGAHLEPVSGPWDGATRPCVRIATDRGEVVALVRPGPRRPRLRLVMTSERELSPFSVDVLDGRADGLPQGVLTERALGMLRTLEGVTVSGEGRQLRLAWPGMPDVEVARVGVELLGELAAGARSVGAFR